MLDIFALVVLLVIAAVAIWLVVLVAGIPGKMARSSEHPHADAINMLAWIGVVTLGMGWFIALVWTQVRPASGELERRVAELERKLSALEGGQ